MNRLITGTPEYDTLCAVFFRWGNGSGGKLQAPAFDLVVQVLALPDTLTEPRLTLLYPVSVLFRSSRHDTGSVAGINSQYAN